MEITAVTKNISDLLSINKKYTIPRFQREYSWEKEHIDAFWDDVCENIVSDGNGNLVNKEYFIGALVLIGDETTVVMKIVDGQQRLTTITIMLSAIVDKLKSIDEQIAEATYTNYIEGTDENGKKYFKIDNETPKPFFQKAIQYIDKDEGLIPSSKEEEKLAYAYNDFCKKLDKKSLIQFELLESITGEEDDKYKKLLIALRDQILKYLKVIYITVKNEEEAGTIFEILNARGMDLSSVDLIKNDIFRSLPREHPDDDAKTNWKKVREILSSREQNLSIDTFFRHFWLSNYSFTRDGKMYESFKKLQKKGNIDPKKFLSSLVSSADKYLIISSPQESDWKRQEEKTVLNSLYALNLFDVTQVRTLLLALLDIKERKLINITDLSKYLSVLEKFHFQFTAVCSSRASGLEGKYSKISRDLRTFDNRRKILDYLDKELIVFLKDKIPEESVFLSSLKSVSYSKHKKLIQYIFKKQEEFLQPTTELEASLITLEHISSQSEDNPLTHCIGNLLPLSGKLNVDADNKKFCDKVKSYKGSILLSVKNFIDLYDVENLEEWSEKNILDRVEALGRQFYSQIWSI